MSRVVVILLAAGGILSPHLLVEADKYDVYAVRFATIANFSVGSLVAGADRSRRLDIAMMVWVLKGVDGRVAVVDSGFHRDQYFRQFAVKDFVKPSEALAGLGLKPDDVTDLIISHMHWDHAGGIDLFPSARVWIQKDEYENLDTHKPIAQTLDAVSNLRAQDRMRTLASDPRLIVPSHDPDVFTRFPHVTDRIAHIELP